MFNKFLLTLLLFIFPLLLFSCNFQTSQIITAPKSTPKPVPSPTLAFIFIVEDNQKSTNNPNNWEFNGKFKDPQGPKDIYQMVDYTKNTVLIIKNTEIFPQILDITNGVVKMSGLGTGNLSPADIAKYLKDNNNELKFYKTQ